MRLARAALDALSITGIRRLDALFADVVSLTKPTLYLFVQLLDSVYPEMMHVALWCERIDFPKAGTVESSRQHDVGVQLRRRQSIHGGEDHARLEADARAGGCKRDVATRERELGEAIEQRALRRAVSLQECFNREVAARVRLVWIRELPFALRARPEIRSQFRACSSSVTSSTGADRSGT